MNVAVLQETTISERRYPPHRFTIDAVSHNFPFFSQRGGTEYTSFRVALPRGPSAVTHSLKRVVRSSLQLRATSPQRAPPSRICSRFIQNVYGAAGRPFREFAREFDSLRLAPGQDRGRLAQFVLGCVP